MKMLLLESIRRALFGSTRLRQNLTIPDPLFARCCEKRCEEWSCEAGIKVNGDKGGGWASSSDHAWVWVGEEGTTSFK